MSLPDLRLVCDRQLSKSRAWRSRVQKRHTRSGGAQNAIEPASNVHAHTDHRLSPALDRAAVANDGTNEPLLAALSLHFVRLWNFHGYDWSNELLPSRNFRNSYLPFYIPPQLPIGIS